MGWGPGGSSFPLFALTRAHYSEVELKAPEFSAWGINDDVAFLGQKPSLCNLGQALSLPWASVSVSVKGEGGPAFPAPARQGAKAEPVGQAAVVPLLGPSIGPEVLSESFGRGSPEGLFRSVPCGSCLVLPGEGPLA